MLAGEPLVIRLSGLPPDAEVTLSARRTVREWTGGSRAYSASARFETSAAGTLELASAVPLDGGSYAGADPRSATQRRFRVQSLRTCRATRNVRR